MRDEAAGRAFDSVPDLYDAARPGYPDEAVEWALGGRAGVVVDLGAGTGILTRQLVYRAPGVIAVDPSPAMLERLRQRLPGIAARTGSAESMGLASGCADAVIAGSAFHWFARPAADREIARVLRAGGTAGLLWNPIDPAHPLAAIIVRIRRELGLPEAEYDPMVELDRRWFGRSERAEFGFTAAVTAGQFVAQLASRSYMAAAPEQFRADALGAARREAEALAGGAVLSLPYKVTAVRARREL
jgi:ubiquinone/menaquinone biosynthesis C-methylase UbiE